MKISPQTKEAYQLFHQATLAFADMESNGLRIDIDYCKEQDAVLQSKIDEINTRLFDYSEVKLWRKTHGSKFNLNSNTQLRQLLFDQLGLESTKETLSGQKSTDEEVLKSIDIPFVKDLLLMRKYQKTKNTYLKNLIDETVDGVLRPSFDLNLARTFRSSSSGPNFQNLPIRDPEQGKIIRSAFIPRKGHRLGGVDFSGIEVRMSAVYTKDPTMIKYIVDPQTDMHRDMAMKIYKIAKKAQVTKKMRYCAKNMFVFPQFYGSYYVQCAKQLWQAIAEYNLAFEDGTSLADHLTRSGISEYSMFEEHMKKVEHDFWSRRFYVYSQWKKEHVMEYEKNGYFDTKTGFRFGGVMTKNEVINYPIQGTACHCLLWALPRLMKWMKKQKMRSVVVGQIHDEITIDAHADEIDDILAQAHQIMCVDIRKAWDWINVPLSIEAEFSEVDQSWYDKKPYPVMWKEEF